MSVLYTLTFSRFNWGY